MKTSSMVRATGVMLVLLVALFFYKAAVERPSPGPNRGSPRTQVVFPLLARTDTSGSTWTVEQTGGGRLVSPDPNAPQAGPPLLVKTTVQRVPEGVVLAQGSMKQLPQRQMSIGLVLEGQAGERYRPAVKKDGKTLSAPTLRIVNEADQVITQGSFQYG